MKIVVSDYTETRINDIIKEACARAWNNGFDHVENKEAGEQEVEEITRKIINIISEYPERVVEL